MDWIERLAARDAALVKQSPPAWDRLCQVLENCIASYNRHYGVEERATASIKRIGSCCDVLWEGDELTTCRRPRVYVQFSLDTQHHSILKNPVGQADEQEEVLTFDLGEDGMLVWACDGTPINEDQASRVLLEPVFFPEVAAAECGDPS